MGLIAGILFDKGYFYQMTFGFSTLFLFSFVGILPSMTKSNLSIKGTLCYHAPNRNSFTKFSSPRASASALASVFSFFLLCLLFLITSNKKGRWRWALLHPGRLAEVSSSQS